jgi:hypothetical protein
VTRDPRQALGLLLWVATLAGIGGGLTYLLAPLSRRGRAARAALWCWAWGLAGWAAFTVDTAVGGARRAHRDRHTGGWRVVRQDATTAVVGGAVCGALAGAVALLTPAGAPPQPRRRGRAGARRPARRADG